MPDNSDIPLGQAGFYLDSATGDVYFAKNVLGSVYSLELTGTAPNEFTGTYTYNSIDAGTAAGANLRNGTWANLADCYGSQTNTNEFLRADLGAVKRIYAVVVATAPSAVGWGAQYTNGALIQTSDDGTTWTTRATLAGLTDGLQREIVINVDARYLRAFRASDYLGFGDFRIYHAP